MNVIRDDKVAFFDVDDTLVHWSAALPSREIQIEFEGKVYCHLVIQETIDALLKHKARGHKIIVWSQGGYKWAEAVVQALNLENTVDLVISKPSWIYDDLQASEWMPKAQDLRIKHERKRDEV